MLRSITQVEPNDLAFCLCGSGLAFRICCKGKYKSISANHIDSLIAEGKAEQALELTRQWLTWYRLAHLAHTEPLVKAGIKAIEPLLSTDIKALEEIIEVLGQCYTAAGVGVHFDKCLEFFSTAIHDIRWHEAYLVLRSSFLLHVARQRELAWVNLSGSTVLTTTNRPELLYFWLRLAPVDISIDSYQSFHRRVLSSTTDSTLHLFSGLGLAFRHIINKQTQLAISELERTLSTYKHPKASSANFVFGQINLFFATSLLGGLKRDKQIAQAAIKHAHDALALGKRLSEEQRICVLVDCGELAVATGALDSAQSFFEAALSESHNTGIALVFLARVHVYQGRLKDARSYLIKAEDRVLTVENKMDSAYVYAELSFASSSKDDIDLAISKLEGCKTSVGCFEDRRVSYLTALRDMRLELTNKPSRKPGIDWLELLNRYVIIEPNFAGLGLRLGNIVDDIAKRNRNAAAKRAASAPIERGP